jgi:hypothetical protein
MLDIPRAAASRNASSGILLHSGQLPLLHRLETASNRRTGPVRVVAACAALP